MINQDSKPTNEKGSTAVTVKPLCSNMEKPNMNMPILTQFNQEPQMTSPELVDFINAYRKEVATSEKPFISLRHDSFMAKVPQVLGEFHAPKFIGTQKHGKLVEFGAGIFGRDVARSHWHIHGIQSRYGHWLGLDVDIVSR